MLVCIWKGHIVDEPSKLDGYQVFWGQDWRIGGSESKMVIFSNRNTAWHKQNNQDGDREPYRRYTYVLCLEFV